ncbi:microspherule protein 1-like isoform X1 [Apostichopus japonicus]|uniref:microspherule protein 1-like isoform X1 n=1 Tax=Stichopus japonicus TaxID=307972 RepID=UPI003AB825B2
MSKQEDEHQVDTNKEEETYEDEDGIAMDETTDLEDLTPMSPDEHDFSLSPQVQNIKQSSPGEISEERSPSSSTSGDPTGSLPMVSTSASTTPHRTQTRSSTKAAHDAAQAKLQTDHGGMAQKPWMATKPYLSNEPVLARSSKGYVFIPPNEYANKRRVSSRSIKRKKFDDELVESSLVKIKPKAGGSPVGMSPIMVPEEVPVIKEEKKVEVMPPPVVKPSPPPPKPVVKTVKPVKPAKPVPAPAPEAPAEKKPKIGIWCTKESKTKQLSRQSSSSSKRSKKSRSSAPSIKELGRWRPEDDLALISAVQQTNDLEAVYQGVKFSKHFSMREVEERWYSLLYDQTVSTLAQQAMRTLHPDIKTQVLAKALFSEDEEKLLAKIGTGSQPTLKTFQDLITKNVTIFHPSRTAKSLHSYWLLMKQYHLLPDQSVQPMPKGDQVLKFSDAEDLLEDNQLQDPRDDILEQELDQFDRRQKRQIQQLENEIPKWTVMVENVTGVAAPEFDGQTLAVLRGRLVRYLMRSKEITLGRTSKDNSIDVDLSLEGPASKVSRKQGLIKLKNNGDFYIANEGKRPIYIEGKPVMNNQRCKLNNNAVVEIAGLRFIFLVNQDLISQMRGEVAKPVVQA